MITALLITLGILLVVIVLLVWVINNQTADQRADEEQIDNLVTENQLLQMQLREARRDQRKANCLPQ